MSRFSIVDAAQRTEPWLAARAGRVTASRADCVVAKIKTGEAAARRDYRVQLAIEIITGRPAESGYINAEMQRGIDLEPVALAAYEARSGNLFRRTGFLALNEHRAGCSLDGDVDDFEGIIEVKCPKSATHVGYLKAGRLPPEYVPQITHQLWVSGAAWADFVSFDDRLPSGLEYFCVRVHRAELDLRSYETEVLKFIAEVDAEVKMLQELRGAA